jgi:hypothetical protein
MTIPLGRPSPSASCDRPERRRGGSPGNPVWLRDPRRSYLVLLPVGFSLPLPLPATRCALTAPFHPCRPPGIPGMGGGVLSVALSLGSPPPGVTRHRTSVEPGLSSLHPSSPAGKERPSDRLAASDVVRLGPLVKASIRRRPSSVSAASGRPYNRPQGNRERGGHACRTRDGWLSL